MGDKYKCPECGETYDRSQGLGIHRWRKHGVKGTRKIIVKRKEVSIDEARKEEAAFACGYIQSWIETYSHSIGVSSIVVAEWVGRFLLRKTDR